MSSLLYEFATQGVTLEASGDGKLSATGNLTGATRAPIRAHKAELLAELPAANNQTVEPAVLRRRTRALATLAEHPEQRIAVVAEHGDPAYIAVAIRGAAVGELETPVSKHDAFRLIELIQQHETA